MKITKKRIKQDERIYKRMEELSQQGLKDTKEYREFHRQYYVENDDLRIYYKTM